MHRKRVIMAIQATPAPLFPLATVTTKAWREESLAAADQLSTVTQWLQLIDPPSGGNTTVDLSKQVLEESIRKHLDAVQGVATRKRPSRELPHQGAMVTRVVCRLDAAQLDVLTRAPATYVQSQLPGIQAHVREHLPKGNPQRTEIDRIVDDLSTAGLDDPAKGAVIQAFRGASSEGRRELSRVRSFRNALVISAVVLAFLATLLAIGGFVWTGQLNLCFQPTAEAVVCPTGSTAENVDLLIVEFFGLLAAAVSGASSLRHVRGNSTPFGLVLALSVLKLPAGALTAVLGLQLMRGEFVPGLSALDSSAQIIAWAIAFGAAQQLFTGLVDRRAQTVLDDVGGKTGTPAGASA